MEKKEVKKQLLKLVERIDKVEELKAKIGELEQQQKKIEERIVKRYEVIKKYQELNKRDNEKLRKIREERKQLQNEIKDIEKLLKALGLKKTKKQKEQKKRIQKFILVNRKTKESFEFRAKGDFIKTLNEKLDLNISKSANLDGIISVIKNKKPYALVKESKTVLRVFVEF